MYFFFRIDVIKAYTAALIQTWDLAFGKGHTIGHYAVENLLTNIMRSTIIKVSSHYCYCTHRQQTQAAFFATES